MEKYSAQEFFETTAMLGLSFSHDESVILVAQDSTKIFNTYAIDITTRKIEPLTQSTSESIFPVSFFPHDNRFLFTKDQHGNELDHLYVQEFNGAAKDLTPGGRLKAEFVAWHQDRDKFWVLTNERDARSFDVYEYSGYDYQRIRIFENRDDWEIRGISCNGRWLALQRIKTNTDVDLYVWDRQHPQRAALAINAEQVYCHESFLSFSPDNKHLYYRTNAHGEFHEAWRYDLENNRHEPVYQGKWDIVALRFSRKGRYRVTHRNEDGRFRVYIRDMDKKTDVQPPAIPDGQMLNAEFSPSESKLAFYVNGDKCPSDLFVLDLDTLTLVRLTKNLSPHIHPDDLVEGQVIRFASFDSLQIPAILYRPKEATVERPVAAMLWVHGGPGGQSVSCYFPLIQHLVNHGIAILAVNNRGSSGYGKAFFHADDKKHGDVDLKDCVWGKKYLQSLKWIDAQRIGIMGASYGGYLTLAALAFAPEEFSIGIDIFGVSNWVRTLEQIPEWWHAARAELYTEIGHPQKDRDALIAKSPLFHADKITRPMLVVQGAHDPRVLQIESDEIVAKVKENGVPVEYLLFNDEGHGFEKKINRIKASEAYLEFIRRYL